MPKPIKLYDLRNRNYPNKRGDIFRSLQIFECWVCGALSNRVIMAGYPGYGVKAVCPNSSECWHHELEEKIRWLNKPHPYSYKKELNGEVERLKKKNKKKIKNDMEGSPDMNLKLSVTNTFSWKPPSRCKHNCY